MRLTNDDLLISTKTMARMTNNKYEIIATKSQYWYWKLEIKNNENWATELLTWWVTTREAYEALRAVYATFRFLWLKEKD